VLREDAEDETPLQPIEDLISDIKSRVPFDGSKSCHFDIILARHTAIS